MGLFRKRTVWKVDGHYYDQAIAFLDRTSPAARNWPPLVRDAYVALCLWADRIPAGEANEIVRLFKGYERAEVALRYYTTPDGMVQHNWFTWGAGRKEDILLILTRCLSRDLRMIEPRLSLAGPTPTRLGNFALEAPPNRPPWNDVQGAVLVAANANVHVLAKLDESLFAVLFHAESVPSGLESVAAEEFSRRSSVPKALIRKRARNSAL
jgi:hypothetical protein